MQPRTSFLARHKPRLDAEWWLDKNFLIIKAKTMTNKRSKSVISQDKLNLIGTYTLNYLKVGESATVQVLGDDGILYPYKFHKTFKSNIFSETHNPTIRKKGEVNNRKPRRCDQV